ncbi:MAG: copper-translocating P-type ATPase [Arenibacterium sp.]
MSSPLITLSVDGMHCGGCVARVGDALRGVSGVEDVSVNLANESATLRARETLDAGTLDIALKSRGFGLRGDTYSIAIENMTCGGCAARVAQAFKSHPAVLNAEVNLATQTAEVMGSAGQMTAEDLCDLSMRAGYPAQLKSLQTQDIQERKQEEAHALRRATFTAAALTLPVFLLEMGGHIYPPLHHFLYAVFGQQTLWLIQFVLTALVLAGPGRQFFKLGLPALWRLSPDMNSLVALGTLSAFVFSSIVLFLPTLIPVQSRAVYFEAAAVIVTLILLGRWMEARARGRTGAAIRALMDLQVPTIRVERDGATADIEAEMLRPGDIVVVRPGERVASDGEVLDGTPYIDESMLTGEPMPVAKSPGDPVIGGTVNGMGSFRFRATRVGSETVLSGIIRMVEQAQATRLPVQDLVDRITLWFVPVIMALASLTVLAWLVFGPDPALSFALVAGVSVLIIACPCAMGLATPVSIMVGTGRGAELGVLFRKGDALQRLENVDIVAFDKTGTLTEGRPVLSDVVLADGVKRDAVLSVVAAIEMQSEHPVARALCEAVRQEGLAVPKVSAFKAAPGKGVEGRVGGKEVRIGSLRYLSEAGIAPVPFADQADEMAASGKTVLFVAIDGQSVAALAVSDPIRRGIAEALDGLRSVGLEIAMITGDTAATAGAVAAELGIHKVIADVLPDGKRDALQQLKSEGAKLAFVGDGINDAPALAEADVGLAVGSGTDVAIEAGDVILISGAPQGVLRAIRLSRAVMRNIRQNLFWAFAYNTALIPLAAGLFYPLYGTLLSPVFAAGAMALSSVFVVSNALRLRRAVVT